MKNIMQHRTKKKAKSIWSQIFKKISEKLGKFVKMENYEINKY